MEHRKFTNPVQATIPLVELVRHDMDYMFTVMMVTTLATNAAVLSILPPSVTTTIVMVYDNRFI
jgi:hypothetical protein